MVVRLNVGAGKSAPTDIEPFFPETPATDQQTLIDQLVATLRGPEDVAHELRKAVW